MTITFCKENNTKNTMPACKFYDLDKGVTITNDFIESYSIIFVKSGTITLESENKDSIPKKLKRVIILIPIGEKFNIVTLSKTQFLIYKFNYRNFYQIQTPLHTLTKEMATAPRNYNKLDFIDVFDEYLNQMIRLRNDGVELTTNSLMYQMKQYEFFVLLEHYYTQQEQANFLYPLLDKELDFEEQVQLYYTKANNVPELAQLCGYNTREFIRKFYKSFNAPPYKWMLQKRAQAVEQDLSGEISIKEIVYKYNFSSPSHLTHFCRKHLGDTPIRLREKINQQMKCRKVY